MKKKNCAIILASGDGMRTGMSIPKQFYKIKGKTVLEYSIEAFEKHDSIDSIIVAANPKCIEETKELAFKYSKVIGLVKGGKTRQESSYKGVTALEKKNFYNVLIHDAARPFVSSDIISKCIRALEDYSAVNVAIKTTDTVIEVDENNCIKNVLEREKLKRCQTPQCFRYSVIKEAHELAKNENFNSATDDCSLILRYDLTPVFVTEGSEDNIKITYISDIKSAEEILNRNAI